MLELLTTEQAAAELRVSKQTLEAWRCRGEGPPFFRVGRRRVAYTREDLHIWLAGRRCDPAEGRASS